MNKLTLIKPIVFFDLETTGTDVETDKIVSIALLKLHPSGEREERKALINPGIPIPEAASEIHGITDDDVKDMPLFESFVNAITTFIDGCDIGGFNCNKFDVPLLFNEFERAKYVWNLQTVNIIDAGNIYKRQEPRTLAAAFQFYTGEVLEGAHDASIDINATLDVFLEQINRYDELPKDVSELALYCNFDKVRADVSGCFTIDEQGDFIFNFGKNKDKKAKLPEYKGYLNWMLGGKFSSDTKRVCNEILSLSTLF